MGSDPEDHPPPGGDSPSPFISGGDSALLFERLRAAVDAHGSVSLTDRQGVLLHVNDRFCETSRFTREELLGKTFRVVNSEFHPVDFWRGLWETIGAGRTWHGLVRNRTRDGALFWVETTIVAVPGVDGRPQFFLAVQTEVTRMKRAEEELSRLTRDLERHVQERTQQLQESEKLYRLLLASVTDYHYTVEVHDGRAVSTTHTPSCLAVTGYAIEEFQHSPLLWLQMVPEEDRPAVLEHAAAALAGRSVPPLEHRIVRKEGQVRWIRDRVVIRRDPAGRVVFYDGILTDITDEKNAQMEVRTLNRELEQRVVERTAQLKAAHDQLRVLFEHAPVGISWVEWGTPNVYHLNDRFCEIIGLTPKEAEDFDAIMRITHPDDRREQEALHERIKRGEIDSFTIEKRYLHPDGGTVWGRLTEVVLRDEKGGLAQQFAMLVDITDRVRAERELRANEQRLRSYFDNASEILYTLSEQWVYLSVSPAWTAKLGYPVAGVVGRPFAEFVHPDDRPDCLAFFRAVRETGLANQSVEYRVRHQDGTWRWHATTGSTIRAEGDAAVFFGIGRDITLRRKAEDDLRAALARREELERIIDRSPSVAVLWSAREGWPVEYVSEGVSQFGVSAREVIDGQVRFMDMIHPGDLPRVVSEVRAHAAAGHREYRQSYRFVTRNGGVRWIEDRTLVRVDSAGRVTHHEGILTDITERREAEEREREVRERDLEVAREVQRHLLPNVYPDISEVEIDTLYTPSRLVGGDYYDFFEVGERRWGFAIADVSGKGTAAALMMSACRTALRVKAQGGWNPATVLRMVNYIVQPDMPEAMFISLIYGILDLETNVFTFCRAGHEPGLVIRANGADNGLLCPSGMALGLDPGPLFDETLEEAAIALEPHDLLVLYTDGITETADELGREYGRERLEQLLRENRHRPLAEIHREVNRALGAFTFNAPAADDRTLLLVRPR